MSKNQPYFQGQEIDERMIVEQMLRGQGDEHWEVCYSFVRKCVYARAQNLPNHHLDDTIQEVMFKITKYLPHFRFQCALKTWVNQIIEHQIIDEYRKLQIDKPHQPPSLVQPPEEADSENPEPGMNEFVSTGDAFEMLEQIRVGIEALLEYANTTSNPVRNRYILRLVLFEGKTYEEAAKAAGCKAPVVGYVVREAQLHARLKWNS